MSLTQAELVALAYGAVLVFVLVYVVIIAAKLSRLERETGELVELARARHAPVSENPELIEVSGEA